jgi:parallel beta-helix repeat protein
METQLRRLKPNKLIFVGLLSLVLASASVSWAQTVVTTLADSGPGSLRQAIIDANADGVATTIIFDPVVFPPALPGVIVLARALPNLTGRRGDTIDGTGAGVVLDGSALAAGSVGLRVRGSNYTIRGLTLRNFPGDGIRVETSPNTQNVDLASVTDVAIDGNLLLRNGSRGIRIAGGQRDNATFLAHTVSASVTNNTVTDSGVQGIAVSGNLLDLPSVDIGGNQVTVFIDGNTVKNTAKPKDPPPSGFGGDGIIVTGGTGRGSNSVVTALISNNTVLNNRDDGIVAVGCGIEDEGSNNHVNITIINNRVQGSGTNAVLSSNVGIAVSAASGEESTVTTCAGNVMRFDVSGNVLTGNRTGGISISGGTGSAHDVQGVVSGNSAKDSPEGRGITVSGGTSGTGNHVHDVTISGNQVSGNSVGGILVTGGTNSLNSLIEGIEIILNNTRSNGGQGILITGGTNSTDATISDLLIEGNTSNDNGTRGIQVTLGATAINPQIALAGVTNNTTNTNVDDGIFIASGIPGSNTPVSGNRADRNGVDGIDIDATGYVVSNNTASRNTVDGIDAVGNINGGGNTGKGNGSCNQPFTGCLP